MLEKEVRTLRYLRYVLCFESESAGRKKKNAANARRALSHEDVVTAHSRRRARRRAPFASFLTNTKLTHKRSYKTSAKAKDQVE